MNLRRFQIIFCLVSVVIFTSCNISSVKFEDIPVPPNTSKPDITTSADFSDTDNKITMFLAVGGYTDVRDAVYKVDLSVSQEDILNFYDRNLTEKGFARKENPSINPKYASDYLWEKKNLFDRQIVLVTFLEEKHISTNKLVNKMLIVTSAHKKD